MLGAMPIAWLWLGEKRPPRVARRLGTRVSSITGVCAEAEIQRERA